VEPIEQQTAQDAAGVQRRTLSAVEHAVVLLKVAFGCQSYQAVTVR